MTLDRYTWDQAAIIRAWSPAAFAAVGLSPANVRKWASRERITAVGIGPNGCKLYSYDAVVGYAATLRPEEVAHVDQDCHTVNAPKTGLPSRRAS